MYASFFEFRELPFNNTPDPRFFYSTPDHEEAVASLIYAVRERKGFVLLTGEVGAGKTLVTRMMLRQFSNRIAFANIHHAIHSPTDLMEAICSEFELPIQQGGGATVLVRTLHDFLLAEFAKNTAVVLVLDEAQNLPVDAFEQLRMIGNLEADDAKLLQIAIVGQPELQQLFLSPALRQLRQRLFRTFHLPALTREHTEAYIRHRLSVAAEREIEIFDGGSLEAIYRASSGLPRLINTICDNALLSAYSASRMTIDAPFLESVLGQLMLGDRAAARSHRSPRRATRGPHAAAPTGAVPASPPQPLPQGSRTPAEPLPDTPMSLRGEFKAALSALVARVDAAEHRAAANATASGDARSAYAALAPLADQARGLIARAEAAARDLSGREDRLQSLAATLSLVTRQLSALLERAQSTASSISVAERQARTTHERLVTQTQRARDQLETESLVHDPNENREVTPMREARGLGRNPVSGDRVLRQALLDTRQSLSGLRDLVRVETTIHQPAPPQAPTARLAQSVEELLRAVGGEQNAPPESLAIAS